MYRAHRDPWPVPDSAPWRRVLGSAAVLQALGGVPWVVCEQLCLPAVEWLPLVAGAFLLASLCAAVAGCVLAPFRPARGARLLVWGLVGIALWIAFAFAARQARRLAFAGCAARAETLVAAIAASAAERGAPPASLQALVPRHLSAVTGTGLPAYPEFAYEVLPASGAAPAAWQLRVSCSSLMSFDYFLYRSDQEYRRERLGSFARLGAWAYVHD